MGMLQTAMRKSIPSSTVSLDSTAQILVVDVSQSLQQDRKRMLSCDADIYATMVAPPGPYKYLEDKIFAGSQRYIGNEKGTLGLEFKLSEMSV